MKKMILFLMLISLFQNVEAKLDLTLSNRSAKEIIAQTVEVEWSVVQKKVPGVTPAEVVVLNQSGTQIPSQVTQAYDNQGSLLIFQLSLKAGESQRVTITSGTREAYPQKTFARFVPERLDDYAWENDKVAFRTYGPALRKELISSGIDVWCKRTDELVIDKRYKLNDYHTDHGDGLDCYGVGKTFGCGSSAVIQADTVCSPGNYETWKTIETGPVRTTFQLTYRPFVVNGESLILTKTFTIDAGSHFFRVADNYQGAGKSLVAVAGVVLHKGAVKAEGNGYLAIAEPASDSKTGLDGTIYGAVILPGSRDHRQYNSNLVVAANVLPGSSFVYWGGAAWSKAGVENLDAWEQIVKDALFSLANKYRVK